MIRTGYSFRNAVGHLPNVIARLKEINWDTAPIADRCSTFGFTRWRILCEANGLRPVYGVELPVAPRTGKGVPFDYWTFLAIDDLKDLHRLIGQATATAGTDGNTWPLLTYAEAHAATGVIKISGPSVLLDNVQPDDPNFYLGLSVATSKGLLRAALAKGLRPCAIGCNNYPAAEDKNLYRVAMAHYVKDKKSNGWKVMGGDTQTYPQHILSDDEFRSWLTSVPIATLDEAIATRERVLSGCTANLTKANLLVPSKPLTLRAMCVAGAATLGVDLHDSVYAARLDRELAMIEEKKFEDYFYIVADLVSYAKERMIVGPARGSSAGSLVCYLLGITAVDPIPYGLLFERFVDLTRVDLPDIDIDFSDVNREEVFKYATAKYGPDRVARLGTVALFEPRSALKKVAIALNIRQHLIDKVTDSLILRSSGDTRAMQQLEDTFNSTEAGRALLQDTPEVVIAAKMEGHPNTASRHAAGIVLTQEPVINYVAIDARNGSVMCDKKDAAALELLKIDALGLTQLSVFERTLELIGKPNKSVNRWLEQLPRDDQQAFDVLNKKHFAGIFQFNGVALQNLTKQITVESLNDIVAITALGRPGPMATGGSGTWVRRRSGAEAIDYPHPLLRPYLEETFGVVVYQETVMQVGREIGGLDWKEVTALRKAMSQSLGTEYFDKFGNKWKAGAIAKGIPQDVADKFWFDLCAFGAWGFNKSHAVSYALVSYWCCYLKAHHPVEFAAATLDAEGDPTRQILLLRELANEGVSYIPVDKDLSTDKWQPTKRNGSTVLLGPLSNIAGIGPKGVQEIMTCRRPGAGQPSKALLEKLEQGKTLIDSLTPIADRLQELYPSGLEERNIFSRPTPVVRAQNYMPGEVMIIGVLRKLNVRDENEATNVQRRGGKIIQGSDTTSLLMTMVDDTDQLFVKIYHGKFSKLNAQEIIERGRVGKAIYAVKGNMARFDFRMMWVNSFRYLGDMVEDISGIEQGGRTQDRTTDSNTGIDQGLQAAE